MASSALVSEVIDAHGGLDRWRSLDEIALNVSTGGLLFTLKGQRTTIREIDARVSPRRRRTVFRDYPTRGLQGVFEDGAVRVETDAGDVVAIRSEARAAIKTVRRRLWWDKLDMLYFCGYALWTYVSIPLLLAEPGYDTRELEPWKERGATWRRILLRFPAEVHTHSREQTLYFDGQGLLRRHDYTPEVIGRRARAAHYCFDHRSFDGVLIPSRRQVFPRRGDNTPLRALVLAWIEMRHVRPGTTS